MHAPSALCNPAATESVPFPAPHAVPCGMADTVSHHRWVNRLAKLQSILRARLGADADPAVRETLELSDLLGAGLGRLPPMGADDRVVAAVVAELHGASTTGGEPTPVDLREAEALVGAAAVVAASASPHTVRYEARRIALLGTIWRPERAQEAERWFGVRTVQVAGGVRLELPRSA